jgi:hypothetical protein
VTDKGRRGLFASTWSWAAPLVVAAIVFGAVLVTTPPGWRAIADVLLASPRGANADAAAYALGSAASLALLTLVVLAAILGGIDFVISRTR